MTEDPGPQTERFKREKLELIKKRGSFCEYCGEKDPDKLSFHHASPARDGGARGMLERLWEWKAHPERFELVCEKCHKRLHSGKGISYKF